MRYHRPVPLETPLRLHARVTGTEGRKVFVDGSISMETDPSVAVVTADGVFVTPDPDRTGPCSRACRPGGPPRRPPSRAD
ncbi:hypothetical protein [Streptomyces sp. NPDC046862]|uniref:hypothetical protein n=1 Tax=Streptomyces sp. NPDC046862 TaxID=3154603 RepID=UPI003454048E